MKPIKLTESQMDAALAQELEVYEVDPDSTLTLRVSDVDCPVHYCKATPGNPCVNMKGKPVPYHPARYVARGEANKPELSHEAKVLLAALK